MLTNRLVGQPIPRVEDKRFLLGQGCYVGDLSMPGLLHAVIVRSPVAHGRIIGIDTAAARALAGVHAILTAADIGATPPTIPVRQEPLPSMLGLVQPVIAHDKVRYVGEPLAVVLAQTAALAEDAAALVALDIAPLPPVATSYASASDEVLLFEENATNQAVALTALRGDPDPLFDTAPYRRTESFTVQRHSAMHLEPRGLLASWDGARLTMYGAAKVAFANRKLLAAMLHIDESAVRMVENDVGGGFGVRGEFYPEDFLIAFAARLLARPVRWLEDRREHMLSANHARDVACTVEIACTTEGKILALRADAQCDIGAYVRTAGSTGGRNVAQVMTGPYRIEHCRTTVSLHLTNKTPVGTYRGPGRFEADFCRERLFDIVAADLGIDRVAFRQMNLVPQSAQPWALPTVVELDLATTTDGGDYHETLRICLDEFDWDKKSADLSGRLIDGRRHGIAVGCYLEGGAAGPREHARLEIATDGKIVVHVGSSSVGQGVETVFSQIAADALDLPLTAIGAVVHGNTDVLAEGFGSYSSRSTVLGGSAILDAATHLRAAWRVAAATRLGCSPAEITQDSDRLLGPDGRALPLAALAGLAADGVFSSTRRTYSYGAHAAHVSVDIETGAVGVHDYVAIEDVGRAINPLTLHGQTLGAVVQGLGGALLEEFVYDDQAQLLTGSLADYLLPVATDIPHIRARILQNHPSPTNPLGAKGAGEGGIIPVGALVANAVADALRAHHAAPNHLPLSPPRVWAMIARA